MTLLNASALFAAFGLLVPIVIHLHRKRKARVIEWPAMQFLTNTVASRRRGLSLENLLLLFVRCLVILLFVLAMAQPLLPSGAPLRPMASVVLLAGGIFGLSAAAVRSLSVRTRITSLVAACMLLFGAAATLNVNPEEFTSPTTNCDLVIVLDETSSMLIEDQQQSPFESAVDEASKLVDRLSGSSTVGIVRCGPVVETVDGSPFDDLASVSVLLTELKPVGGGASSSEAIDQAVALAKRGPNSRKQVVLFTDDQLRTWESLDESPSLQTNSQDTANTDGPESDADEVSRDDSRVHLAIHVANLPDRPFNVSVDSTRIESAVPAVGQSLLIEAEVRNHGDTSVANLDIQLLVDGKPVTVETADALPPKATTTIRFPYTFETAGEHVVTTHTEYPDALIDDNRCDTVVSVVPFISVLLVNGNAFAKPGDQSATFIQLSLDPISRSTAVRDETAVDRPVRIQSVGVSALRETETLIDYDVIVLCEVPQLPQEIATELSNYVQGGGGLWIIPDQFADANFYNAWKIEDSETAVLPATLMNDKQTAHEDADANAGRTGIELQTIASGFVGELIETGEHDLAEVVVSRYHRVSLRDTAVAAIKLTNGDPLFVEHAMGMGRVLLQTAALGRQDCNLPQRVCFPVLMHLWSYYLADCHRDHSNFGPTPELFVPVSLSGPAAADLESLMLIDPAGEERTSKIVHRSQSTTAQIRQAGRPGVYTLSPPSSPEISQSFTIARDHRESDLAVISEEKLSALQSTHGFQWLGNGEKLRMAGVAERTEHELSPYLLLVVLCLIAAESLLAAWIRRRRMGAVSSPQPAAAQMMRTAVRVQTTATVRVTGLNANAPASVLTGGAR